MMTIIKHTHIFDDDSKEDKYLLGNDEREEYTHIVVRNKIKIKSKEYEKTFFL